MKNTNLKKKNSLGKIIGMKINDYSWHIKFFSSILITIGILISPVFISNFKWCTGLAILTALIISILVIWLLFAIIKFFIINSISLSRVRYIPLTENEVKDNQLDTIEKYAEFINNLSMLAQVCNLKVGTLDYSIKDAHIYVNQIDSIKEQIRRFNEEGDFPAPTLWLNPDIDDFFEFDNSRDCRDVKLIDYKHFGKISFPIAQ